MKIAYSKEELKKARDALSGTVGFVPTMGALHAGHLSLVALAKARADHVIASVFVNPTQFAPHEDFNAYPREEAKDAEKLRTAGVDILYLPTADDLYADGYDSPVETGESAKGLESDFRPTHFAGVVNVVYRLFQAVHPDAAIFGEKDYQQLQVIKEMVAQYKLPVEIIGAPIARDECGLALSSRNAYLSADELAIARKLNIVLKDCAQTGDTETAKDRLLEAGFQKIDYVSLWNGRILAAAWLGKTRLIDNFPISA